jgi:crotonobetainyl-CoA:carnitine CoA-transferase CaiB-like acyl-CoA transferase
VDPRGLWLDERVHGLRLVAPPIRIDGERAVATTRSPRGGEHTERVLREVLGYDDERIAGLRRARAIPGEPT